jgi:acyl-CoA dehydrogenase
MEDQLIADALQRLLAAECTPNHVRAIEAGGSAQGLWDALENAGFADAMVPQVAGGAGLTLSQAFALFEICGQFALPLPLADTMVVRGWLAGQGLPAPGGPIDLSQPPADWHHATAASPFDALALQASLYAAQMAGAMQHVLAMTLQYANQRVQFGRPIGKFQAIQHQLALMAEQTLAARMAAQIGCSSTTLLPQRLRAAIAKARASEAAVEVAALSHSIHGAIGFTQEFDLQIYTRRLHHWRQAAGSESHWHDVLGAALIDGHQGQTLDLIRQTTD